MRGCQSKHPTTYDALRYVLVNVVVSVVIVRVSVVVSVAVSNGGPGLGWGAGSPQQKGWAITTAQALQVLTKTQA